jgi:HD-GYP domain-containing protein (c-di-GMP phosphodiesterase class II)
VAAIRHHHERFDGSGYPDGLAGGRIPLMARMLALADSYDAMRSARPYGPGLSRAEALQVLRREAGTHFDPYLTTLFIRMEVRRLGGDGTSPRRG